MNALFLRATSFSVFGLLASAGSAQYPGAKPVPSEWRTGYENINPADCRQWLTYLTSKDLQGRGSGQPGYQKAAEFMAARYKEWGLKPGGENGTYFQNVPFARSRMSPASHLTIQGSSLYLGATGNFLVNNPVKAEVQAEPVFIRITDAATIPEDAPLAGKVLIVMGGQGRNLRRDFLSLRPAAILRVGELPKTPDYSIRPPGRRGGSNGGVLMGTISEAAAQKIAQAQGIELNAREVTSFDLQKGSKPVKLSVDSETDTINVPNVLAILEGTDPELKSEVVGIGAHLDHMGTTPEGVMYPGADDDGSGSTALLAMARAFVTNPVKPKRSIIFMSFCGEEMGLIGSSWYADHPVFPNEKMQCELQVDMVGRNEEGEKNKPENNVDTISLIGSKRISTELHQIVLDANKYVNFRFKYTNEDVYTRSDHYMFAVRGIPIAFLFDGFHPDYHRPTDTVDKINFDKIANSAKLFYLVGQTAASLDHRLKRDVGTTSGGGRD